MKRMEARMHDDGLWQIEMLVKVCLAKQDQKYTSMSCPVSFKYEVHVNS